MYIDSFFFYKYVVRFILINKLGNINNTLNLNKINKIFLNFNFKKLEDLNDIQLYNKLYLFKFFLGKNAFLSKTKKVYLLGNWFYSFNIQLIISDRKNIYLILYIFFNNIIINVEKNLIKNGVFSKKLNIYFFLIKDLNIYSELKTNLGLFNIKKFLNIKIFFSGCDYKVSKILLFNLKYL